MAKIVNFKNRITDLAGSLGTADDNAIEQWALDGCYDVIRRIKSNRKDDVNRFVKQVSMGTGSISVSLDDVHQVMSVENDTYPARYVSPAMRKKITDTESIYYVNEDTDPVWYIHDGNLITLPNPSTSSYYYSIPEYAISDFDHVSNTSKIADFPPDYYEHICLYAAIEVLKRRLLDLDSALPSSVSIPALPILPVAPEAPKHGTTSYEIPDLPVLDLPGLALDTGAAKPGAMYYLEDEEDIELLNGALSVMDKKMAEYDKTVDRAMKQFERDKAIWERQIQQLEKNADWREAEISREIGLYGNNLTKYSSELTAFNASLSKAQNEIQNLDKVFTQERDNIKQEYEWVNGRLQMLSVKYNGLFGNVPAQQ